MILSKKAWGKSLPVIEAIKKHPFNVELAAGTLATDKFSYYIEQDTLYLREFARCHAMIAAKVPLEYMQCFLRYSQSASVAEQGLVHGFFRECFKFQDTGLITTATFCYVSYLLQACAIEPVEVAIASVLPCFWVYQEVGLSIAHCSSPINPFSRWIDTYAGQDFTDSVQEAISIFDAVASKTADEIRAKMIDAFYKSTVFEWHFWNDSYNKTSFDGCLSQNSAVREYGCRNAN